MFSEAITEEHIYPRPGEGSVFPATVFERSAAIAVVTLAFATDPVARWLYPDAADYLTHFPHFIRGFAGAAFEAETAYMTSDMSGAALWLPPGFGADDEQLNELFELTVPERLKPELFEMFDQMAAFHPKEPHWYLPMIGVETRSQGKGIGAKLMRHALERADADGLPAYLESSNPRNISLYERFGFAVVGTIKAGSAPPMYPMYRRPLGG